MQTAETEVPCAFARAKKGLGALLIPNIDELRAYARQKFSDLREEGEDLLTSSRLLEHVRREMNRLLQPGQGFKVHEKLQGIAFLDKEFKLGEELTNTLKKKRHVRSTDSMTRRTSS